MNSVMERWAQACRHELLDRTLIRNQSHLLHALREFETHDHEHRPRRTPGQAAAPPDRSTRRPTSHTSRSAEETDSAEPSTSTDMPHDQAG